jgi:hypothetical protein
MQDWKKLPAYKTEPRIDSLIGFYLPDMASDFLGDKITGIIPELPIRLGTVKPQHGNAPFADKSYKVDFFLLGASGTNYFVEFKTDSGSRREKQDEYLCESKSIGMAAIVRGIITIASVSSYKKKYDHLLEKLNRLGLIDASRKYTGAADLIEIVYVQPHRKADDTKRVMDFVWISKWLSAKYGHSDYESALSKTLLQWTND